MGKEYVAGCEVSGVPAGTTQRQGPWREQSQFSERHKIPGKFITVFFSFQVLCTAQAMGGTANGGTQGRLEQHKASRCLSP